MTDYAMVTKMGAEQVGVGDNIRDPAGARNSVYRDSGGNRPPSP